jgi:hypothetical protein
MAAEDIGIILRENIESTRLNVSTSYEHEVDKNLLKHAIQYWAGGITVI